MSAIEKIAEIDTEFEDVLSYFNGDKNAAIRSLLNDCRTLRAYLHAAENLMSAGYTRHWKPSKMGGE